VRIDELAPARVAVWGYGREGRAALHALRRRFPDKQLTLFCSPEETGGVGADASLEIATKPPDLAALRRFDVIIKSPGISPYKSPIPEAQAAAVRFTSGTALWFAEHPDARTICVTGTKGKSTVTALVAHLLRKSGKCVALAGNIGLPLLDLLEPPREPDWWVIELSSFQTHDFGGAPTVAVVNNIYQEHLDWHGDQVRYQIDKAMILDHSGIAVLNAADPVTASIRAAHNPIWFNVRDGWQVRDDAIFRADERVLPLAQIPLRGVHNAQNVCAALAAIEAAGADARELARHVTTFRPLPHRLQSLGTQDGLEYINDSIATTPYATIEALRSLQGRAVTVIVGGFDRGVDWAPFVKFVSDYPCVIVTMGANGPDIAKQLAKVRDPIFLVARARNLADALGQARQLATAGGVILLSPGAPSFDQFRDYAERGREFARLTGFDSGAIAQIDGLGIA